MRFWWVLAFCLLVATAYLAVSELSLRAKESRLIRNGVLVDATVQRIGTMEIKGHSFPPDSEGVLQFDYAGQIRRVVGRLAGRAAFIDIGQKVPLHIDAGDPTIWTARTEPEPMSETLLGALLVFPSVLIVGLVAIAARARTLRLWEKGTAVQAIAVETRPSPLCPSRGIVRCTPVGEGDDRLFTVYTRHPARRGDLLWVIAHPRHRRAAAADWFEPDAPR